MSVPFRLTPKYLLIGHCTTIYGVLNRVNVTLFMSDSCLDFFHKVSVPLWLLTIGMHFIAYNLIRCVMQKAVLTCHADLNRISFKGCLDTVRQFANAAQGVAGSPRKVADLVDEMLSAIASDLNPYRLGRSEPRAKKRRQKNYQLLTKPRHEMGNLPHRSKGAAKNPKAA